MQNRMAFITADCSNNGRIYFRKFIASRKYIKACHSLLISATKGVEELDENIIAMLEEKWKRTMFPAD